LNVISHYLVVLNLCTIFKDQHGIAQKRLDVGLKR